MHRSIIFVACDITFLEYWGRISVLETIKESYRRDIKSKLVWQCEPEPSLWKLLYSL